MDLTSLITVRAEMINLPILFVFTLVVYKITQFEKSHEEIKRKEELEIRHKNFK